MWAPVPGTSVALTLRLPLDLVVGRSRPRRPGGQEAKELGTGISKNRGLRFFRLRPTNSQDSDKGLKPPFKSKRWESTAQEGGRCSSPDPSPQARPNPSFADWANHFGPVSSEQKRPSKFPAGNVAFRS